MAELRPLIVKVAKMITGCMDAKFGLVKMDETRPEYWIKQMGAKVNRKTEGLAMRSAFPILAAICCAVSVLLIKTLRELDNLSLFDSLT